MSLLLTVAQFIQILYKPWASPLKCVLCWMHINKGPHLWKASKQLKPMIHQKQVKENQLRYFISWIFYHNMSPPLRPGFQLLFQLFRTVLRCSTLHFTHGLWRIISTILVLYISPHPSQSTFRATVLQPTFVNFSQRFSSTFPKLLKLVLWFLGLTFGWIEVDWA